MYQWKEKKERREKKKVGGGTTTTTTYSYHEEWSDSLINSDNFHEKASDKKNPKDFPITATTQRAAVITMGGFKLSDSLVGKIDNSEDVSLAEKNIPQRFSGQMKLQGDRYLYLGQNVDAPEIGDCRVSFVVTRPAEVSVVSQQTGETFRPYQTEAGDPLDMLRMGNQSADQMFKLAHDDNRMLTWILRGVGAFVMFMGLMMFAKPISVLADVIPFLGNIAETGLAVIAGLLTIAGACTTIGVAWLFYRPLIGVPLLVVALGAVVLLFRSRGGKQKNTADDFDLDAVS